MTNKVIQLCIAVGLAIILFTTANLPQPPEKELSKYTNISNFTYEEGDLFASFYTNAGEMRCYTRTKAGKKSAGVLRQFWFEQEDVLVYYLDSKNIVTLFIANNTSHYCDPP